MQRPLLLLLVAISLVLTGCAGDEPSTRPSDTDSVGQSGGKGTKGGAPKNKEPKGEDVAPVEDPAPDFAFETFDGETFSFSEQRGVPIVLNFWESW